MFACEEVGRCGCVVVFLLWTRPAGWCCPPWSAFLYFPDVGAEWWKNINWVLLELFLWPNFQLRHALWFYVDEATLSVTERKCTTVSWFSSTRVSWELFRCAARKGSNYFVPCSSIYDSNQINAWLDGRKYTIANCIHFLGHFCLFGMPWDLKGWQSLLYCMSVFSYESSSGCCPDGKSKFFSCCNLFAFYYYHTLFFFFFVYGSMVDGRTIRLTVER